MRKIVTGLCLCLCLAGCATPQPHRHEDPILDAKLKAVIIPEMIFNDAVVYCPIAFCQAVYSERYSPSFPGWHDAPQVFRENVPEELALRLPRVNIAVRNISLYDAAKLIAKQTGLELTLEEGTVWFRFLNPEP